MRRTVLKKVGGFDSDFFIYVEETDLAWRCLLQGHHNVFLPSAIVYHEYGTSTIILNKNQNEYNAKFHGCKNYIMMHIKNLSLLNLLKILPVHIAIWICLAFYTLVHGKVKSFLWILSGIGWNIVYLPQNIRKRSIIQKRRLVSDNNLFRKLIKHKPLSYYFNKLHDRTIGNAEGFIKTLR